MSVETMRRDEQFRLRRAEQQRLERRALQELRNWLDNGCIDVNDQMYIAAAAIREFEAQQVEDKS